MKKLVCIFVVFALAAYAGTRAAETTGAIPASTDAGVSLNDSVGCRFSARIVDGGTLNGGTLGAYYYDANLGWVRSASSLDCTLEANKLIDGGAPSAQVCPDLEPLARFGRISAASKNLVNGAGTAVTAQVRVECWGPAIP